MSNAVDPIRQVLAQRPNTIVVLRRYFDDGEQASLLHDGQAGGVQCARIVAARFTEILALSARIYLESLNEIGLDTQADQYNAFTVGFCEECGRMGLRPAVYCFSTGCPPGYSGDGSPADLWAYWAHYADGLRACLAAGGALALHEYGWPDMRDQATWHCLRYRRALASFPDDLKDIPILITETGLDRGVVEGVPDAPNNAGWRNAGISAEQYAEQLAWYDAEISKDANVLGATVFTCGGYWQSFDLTGVWPVLDRIAKEVPTMALTETKFTLASEPVLYAGQVNTLVIEASGVGQGAWFLTVECEKQADGETKWLDDPTTFGGLVVTKPPAELMVNGRNIIHVYVQPFNAPGPIRGTLRIAVGESDGAAFEGGDRLSAPVTLDPSGVAAPVEAPAAPPEPAAPDIAHDYTPAGVRTDREAAMWGALWIIKDRLPAEAHAAFIAWVRWGKGEIDEMPVDPH